MKVIQTELAGVSIIEPQAFDDNRGWLMESWSKERYEQTGIKLPFVQDNVSFSTQNVLRGLHFQYPHSQGKLVQVLAGEVFDVAADIRVGSPTFGRWVGENLSAANHKQLYIPPGFAHGFCVISDTVVFSYKCTDYYSPNCEAGIIYNDPDINIAWPVANALIVSQKDAGYPRLKDIPKDKLPLFEKTK